MRADIIFIGVIASIIWIFVWYRAFCRSPLGWSSPTSLFATGLLAFYIVPSLYWQFRSWNYIEPPYFDGLHLVLGGAVILGLPFIYVEFLLKKRRKISRPELQLPRKKFYELLWVLVIPVLIGMGWRIYLVTLGWQGRLEREIPSVLGSESLALIIYNFYCYFAACYFGLVAFGNKAQRRAGIGLWAVDFVFELFLLHRYWILLFMLRSAVFATLLGWKPKLRQWAVLGLFFLFVMAVVGKINILSYSTISGNRSFMSPMEAWNVLRGTTTTYYAGGFKGWDSSSANNALMRVVDDTMYRLYDARSASAVMISVPDTIPYFYGETFIHVFYSLVPRFFWPDKPDLIEINRVTALVMPSGFGSKPTGTIAEFYMNYGFLCVLLGGLASLFFCRWGESILIRGSNISPVWLIMYPLLAEQFLLANHNFTERLSEGIRCLVVLALLAVILRLA